MRTFRIKKKYWNKVPEQKSNVSREAKSIHKWSLKPVSVLMLSRFVSSLKITEDFIAAYQANYGFTKEGEPDASSAAVSSTDPEKEKKGDDSQKPKPDEQETPAKEAKQKGEKRKLEPGSATSKHREERGNRCNTQIGIK